MAKVIHVHLTHPIEAPGLVFCQYRGCLYGFDG